MLAAEPSPGPSPSVTPSPSPRPFAIPSTDGTATITGELDLPGGEACDGKRVPAALLIPGSGTFDRDVDYGNSGSDRDLLFKQLSDELLARGMATVRFDQRGVRCSRYTMPPAARDVDSACVDRALREKVTPESLRDDVAAVYAFASASPCLDPAKLVVFAHSEGSIHAAALIRAGRLNPRALVFLGGVAERPADVSHWQATEARVSRLLSDSAVPGRLGADEAARLGLPANPSGYWTREQLLARFEKEYAAERAKWLAEPDTGVAPGPWRGLWSMRWWKLWWREDEPRVADELKGFHGPIVAFAGARDSRVPPERSLELFKAAGAKTELLDGLGHSLGFDPAVGPMSGDAQARLADEIARAGGLEPKPSETIPMLGESEMARHPYMGMTFEVSPPLPADTRYRSKFGLRVLSVGAGFPAWQGGIRPGDVLIGMNGEEVGATPKERALAHFIRRIQELAPGGSAHVSLLRYHPELTSYKEGTKLGNPSPEELQRLVTGSDPNKEYSLRWKREPEWKELDVPVRLPHVFPARAAKAAPPGPVERLAGALEAKYALTREFGDLRRRIADMTARPDPFRLEAVDFVQHHPFAIRSEAERLLAPVRARARDPLAAARAWLEGARELLGESAPPAKLAALRTGLSPDEHLAQIERVLAEANRLRDAAFVRLSAEEKEFLEKNLVPLAAKFEEWNYLYQDIDADRLARNERVIDLASRVDRAKLVDSALELSRLAEPAYARALKRDLARAKLDLGKETVLSRETPYGRVLIGGTGDNRYTALDDIAVVIDLGGDDFYGNRAGASGPKARCSIVVDLEGDDVYESSADWALASGVLGVGIIADLGGDDQYIGMRGTEGAGLLGVGIVMDWAGDDVYRARSLSQGCGLFGAGGLFDGRGDDEYESRLLSQGVGIAGGFGALADGAGDDRYFSKALQPSGYGASGTFEGWSQGAGIGIRFLASGGIGMLIDGGGHDLFEAGDFSQGGGYYFGWGMLDHGGKDGDRYVGSRYAQGFAAHSSLGTFLGGAGDDRYENETEVGIGIAMDYSVAWFEDRGGNDRYATRHFSVGSSAHNAISVFVDRAGRDRFEGPVGPANGQVNDYHGGKSLSLFLKTDPAGAKSFYSFPPPTDGAPHAATSFFFDRRGTLEDLARER